jgi:hypothetical protein
MTNSREIMRQLPRFMRLLAWIAVVPVLLSVQTSAAMSFHWICENGSAALATTTTHMGVPEKNTPSRQNDPCNPVPSATDADSIPRSHIN